MLFTTRDPIKRLETVRAVKEACLLQLKVSDLEGLAKPNKLQAAGSSFKADYDILMSFLAQNHETKQGWRKELGIVPTSPMRTKTTKFGASTGTQANEFNTHFSKHPQESQVEFF